jgi:glutathione synthase/RimK-type ligase-like ATP-grasp enzyme
VRIAFFMRPDPADADAPAISANTSEVSDEIVARLRESGAEVDEIVPEARAWDLTDLRLDYDLYVLKSKNPLDLDLAESLERSGACVINTAQASRLAKDKIVHTTLLARAGIPQPRAWTVASFAALEELLEGLDTACLVKPPAGSMAQGIYTLRRISDLSDEDRMALRDSFVDGFGQPNPLLVQAQVPNDGSDVKVYVVGEWVAAVERPLDAKTEAEKRGKPAEVTPAIRDAALAAGKALSLEIYGADFLRSPGSDDFWVVDVNAFPSYKGMDGATERIVELLLKRARE